jgi:hypothetical protein
LTTKNKVSAATPDALPNIALPVITHLEVDGYQLFPGIDGGGLIHDFEPGVTVVAGINGLGKTTLLTLLLRMLLGPLNPEKATPYEVGAKSHDMVPWFGAKDFFGPRVADAAVDATATAHLVIGSHKMKITRRLTDLSIRYLEYNAREIEASEEFYEAAILEATNASSRYDFDFLVRYLVFFLEQRVPLFWNDRGQIEIFRILLCDSDSAQMLSTVEDDIKELDSHYRNTRWQAGKRQKRYGQLSAALAGSSTLEAKAAALHEEARALEEKNAKLMVAVERESEARSQQRTRLLLTKIEFEEAKRSYEALQEGFLAGLFPQVSESARHIFTTLLSHSGCVVCGNRSPRGYRRLERLLARDDCPACESPIDEQERAAPKHPPKQADLQPAAVRLTELQRAVDGLEKLIKAGTARIQEFGAEHSSVQYARFRLADEIKRTNARLPPTAEELVGLKVEVEADEANLKKMRSDLELLYVQYERLLQHVTERVTEVSEIVQSRFSHYASAFLSEKCFLGQSVVSGRMGESRSFSYPCFNLYMTSAVSPTKETERQNIDDVSESQREFIDLAFRMALIAAVTASGARAMLVIETPEASLDEYFVEQAGLMLRQFSRGDEPDGNVLIVSSNLATQNMIKSLLGFTGKQANWPDSRTVNKRLINLLEVARPNAALRDHRERYEAALKRSTEGRWQPRAR